jgi:hypothetical protein
MAIWRTWTRADGTRGLLYLNLLTGAEHRCGILAAQTPDELIVSWVVTRGGGKPWDLISFDTGTVYLVMAQTASA